MIMDVGVAEFDNGEKRVQINFVSTEGDYKCVYHLTAKMAEQVAKLIQQAADNARTRIISGVNKPS